MAEVHCPDCGSLLPRDAAIEGLCPQCLLSMALEDSSPDIEVEELETRVGSGMGRILGERYQIREVLGRGGMGEVYRAFDLKLRVDVALKSVRPELLESEKARELLRQEVRSAREVVSPNVCRIFDLVVEEGRELVSMEYIDGSTLADTLRERGPLELREAREIASQFLSGLEAIHDAGLVHRDFKPENVMLTRAGRVVVMDFGLAKPGSDGQKAGTIAGTPAYMSPEQSRGEPVDARADVFSVGIVLAEMLTPGPRDAVWQAVRESPPQVPEGPWASVLRQALAADRESRPETARALARALDDVTHRLPGFEDKHPYPGLLSFTEEDAEYFFGREVEVEAVWKKLKRPRLLALIGPSGAGKSSFLRAGLLPTVPRGWSVCLSTPGHRPLSALAESLLPAFAGDMQAIQSFLRFDEPETAVSLFSSWRQKSEHALVIVDQFEELFTLNRPEVQEAFATLLGRLVLDADVHVLLSLRDDFLFHCQKHESLSPVFSELTPLGALSPSALRRALVQPALACGYRFEEEALVEEMVSEVGHERGVLPLLAFAASRLWDKRDREKGFLTREAYQEIGGVGGALARHAEETLNRIGEERTPLVRELFRNLVTAQGTRASREVEELLSIFPKEEERRAAEEVLRELVAARLLTSYEDSVEIIHESLLSAWPRLVQWRNQDEGGALLRDQLRQAAQVWQDRGRREDLLWTGSSYREFALWRERYSGGLSATEEAFAESAKKLAERKRRRRRLAVASIVVVLLAVIAAIGTSRQQAVTEARRAEASKLLALGQLELETYPTAALAYAQKSLELADTEVGRLFALRVSQRAPLATLTPIVAEFAEKALFAAFSPSGEWLALGGKKRASVLNRNGSKRLVLGDYPEALGGVGVAFGPGSDTLATNQRGDVRVFSIPEGREIRRGQFEKGLTWLWPGDDGFLTTTNLGESAVSRLRLWPFKEGESRVVGTMAWGSTDIARGRLAYPEGRRIYLRRLSDWSAPPRLVAEHEADVQFVALSPDGERLAASDGAGEVRIWQTEAPALRPLRVLHGKNVEGLRFDSSGNRLAGNLASELQVAVWDLSAPPGTEPWILQRNDTTRRGLLTFDPSGDWLVTTHDSDAAFWALDESLPRVLAGHEAAVSSLAFTPDGKALVSASEDGTVRVWPLGARSDRESHVLLQTSLAVLTTVSVDSASRNVMVQDVRESPSKVLAIPLAGGRPRELFRCERHCGVFAFGDGGRLVATTPSFQGPIEDRWVIRVLDVEAGTLQKVEPAGEAREEADRQFLDIQFLGRQKLLASHGNKGLFLCDLAAGTSRILEPRIRGRFALSSDGDFVLGLTTWSVQDLVEVPLELIRFNLDGTRQETLRPHGPGVTAVALDPTDTLVATGSSDGTVRIGPVSGEEPYVFSRHTGRIWWVAFSPDGRWLASAGSDKKIILWPVPDLSKPPLHKRPYKEVLAWLRSKTNLRVVPDPDSATGWKLDRDPFPGWAKRPER